MHAIASMERLEGSGVHIHHFHYVLKLQSYSQRPQREYYSLAGGHLCKHYFFICLAKKEKKEKKGVVGFVKQCTFGLLSKMV